MELSEHDLRDKYWERDYRSWHATGSVRQSADKDLVGKLLSGNWQQEYSAAAELWMRTRFERLGLNFEFQPNLHGKTPDFLIRERLGRGVVADAAVLHSGPLWDLDSQQKEYQTLRQRILEVETEHFATSVLSIEGSRSVVKGRGGGSVAIRKILHGVRTTANELERKYNQYPNWLSWEPQWMEGVRSATRRLTFPQLSTDLKIEIVFYLKEDETDEHLALRKFENSGAIGVMSTITDEPGKRLNNLLKGKISYLRKFNDRGSETQKLAYMVIIFDPDSSVDTMYMEKVLHGSSTGYDLGLGNMHEELREWIHRSSPRSLVSYEEGLFNSRHKAFLAVLKCTGDFRNTNGCEPSIWMNPYANLFRIPQPLFQLKTYSLSRQIYCTPPA